MERNRLHIKDLANPAGALTISRLAIAVSFPFLVHDPKLAIGAYAVAIATDLADGAVARRMNHASHTGAVLDGWVDKILHINGAWSMALHNYMPAWWMWLWFTRELIQWAMVMTIIGDFKDGSVRVQQTSVVGRCTAVCLFGAFLTSLAGWLGAAWILTVLTGGFGLASGLGYLRRHLEDRKRFD